MILLIIIIQFADFTKQYIIIDYRNCQKSPGINSNIFLPQITMVSPFKPPKVRENVREVQVTGVDIQKVVPNMFAGKAHGPITLMNAVPKLCSDALEQKAVQDLLKEKYDLVMLSAFMAECFLSIVHQLKVIGRMLRAVYRIGIGMYICWPNSTARLLMKIRI